MDELQAFIDEQKALDPDFAESYDEGYEQFRTGVLLRQALDSIRLTQEEIAGKLSVTKSTD